MAVDTGLAGSLDGARRDDRPQRMARLSPSSARPLGVRSSPGQWSRAGNMLIPSSARAPQRHSIRLILVTLALINIRPVAALAERLIL